MKRRIVATAVLAAGGFLLLALSGGLSKQAEKQSARAGGEYLASQAGGFVSKTTGVHRASQPMVLRPAAADVSPPMRDINLPAPPGPAQFQTVPEPGNEPLAPTGGRSSIDPIVQRTNGPKVMPATAPNFEGITNTVNSTLTGFFNNPPDVEGDVGVNDYIEYVNKSWAIYSKAGVVRVGWPKANAAIWSGFTGTGATCASAPQGDPNVLYDRTADRWVLSEFAIGNSTTGPFVQCIAVSQTNDPTGAYYRYAYDFTTTGFQDYPHFGVWPDAYYMSANIFTNASATGTFVGRLAAAFNRTKMLVGDLTAEIIFFNAGTAPPSTLQPTDQEGAVPPTAGEPNFFWAIDDPGNALALYKFHVDFGTPANSTFTTQPSVAVAAFDANMCGGARSCIPQPPAIGHTTDGLDAIAGRITNHAVYRRFVGAGAHESIVLNHTVDENGSDHAGIRWYEFRDPNGSPTVFDSGTYAPDSDNRWMGSASMDGSGNIAVGYSVSSSTTHPSIRYAGRLTSDTAGTLGQGEATLQAGAGSFWRGGFGSGGSSRWGDYTAMQIDPVDDCTFWYIDEYILADTDRDWHDRIGAFKFPGCSAPTAVAVARFAAARTTKGVVVRWRTRSEANIVGFHLWRTRNAQSWSRVNARLIPAKASGTTGGAPYSFVDRLAAKRGFLNYRLQVVDRAGKLSWYATGATPVGR